MREGWGTFSNVSSKCPLKITGALEKVGSEGAFFSPSVRLDTTMFIWPSCCLIWWDRLCQFLNTLGQGAPVNINERHPWANTRSWDKQRLSSQSLSILIFWPTVNRMSRLPQGTRGEKKGIFCSMETRCYTNIVKHWVMMILTLHFLRLLNNESVSHLDVCRTDMLCHSLNTSIKFFSKCFRALVMFLLLNVFKENSESNCELCNIVKKSRPFF